mmetsp:Transcript_6106/g.23745  ORF Transcript_6106/g.23745 Transcript_6106/m.23745 type:complete len:208 (-) Transcript_6106:48-671(-)
MQSEAGIAAPGLKRRLLLLLLLQLSSFASGFARLGAVHRSLAGGLPAEMPLVFKGKAPLASALFMGQPGGRTGCCWKAATYLEKMELRKQPPAAAAAVSGLVENLGTSTLKENLAIIDECCDSTPKPFSIGELENSAEQNQASARLLSLALLLDLNKEDTLELWGDVWREVRGTEGTNHGNIRAFEKLGFDGVSFPEGLAISWKAEE